MCQKRAAETSSLNNGFFSLPLLNRRQRADQLRWFHRQSYVVPQDTKEFTSILIELSPDVTFLKEVVVTMPTEELFKEAVLALNVPSITLVSIQKT